MDVTATAAAVQRGMSDHNAQAEEGRAALSRAQPAADGADVPDGWRRIDRMVGGVHVVPSPWLNLHFEDFLPIGPALGVLFRWFQEEPGRSINRKFAPDRHLYLYLHEVSPSEPADPSVWDQVMTQFERWFDADGTWRERCTTAVGPSLRVVHLDPAVKRE